MESDFDSGELNCIGPRDFAAKFKTYDEDNPSYSMVMTGEYYIEYQRAMVKEIRQLIKQHNWCSIPRSSVPKGKVILSGTWAFKLKCLPDGTNSKLKAKYCIRGGKQIEGIDYFDIYAPIVQWSTVRLVLTMVLTND